MADDLPPHIRVLQEADKGDAMSWLETEEVITILYRDGRAINHYKPQPVVQPAQPTRPRDVGALSTGKTDETKTEYITDKQPAQARSEIRKKKEK